MVLDIFCAWAEDWGVQKNVTLKLDARLLTRVRHLAVDEDTSLSGWLQALVQRAVEERDAYTGARRVALAHLDKGWKLGGRALTREEAHERGPLH